MVTTIKALTPAEQSAGKFEHVETHDMVDFRDWAEGHDASCFRKYAIEISASTLPSASDSSVELRETTAEIIVAYPHHFSLYADGGKRAHSMRDMIEADMSQIAKAVGYKGSANYVSGQHAAVEDQIEVEPGDGVSFGVLPLTVTYYYNVS